MKINTIGILYIIAAPSGGGKTSLVKNLLHADHQLRFSVSHTTRPQRHGELDGQDYYFISLTTFENMINHDEFLEYAWVFNNYYGTSKRQLLSTLEQGFDVLLEIDWQGARHIRQQFANCTSIFIVPPSYEILSQRLIQRKQDNEATIQSRMAQAKAEISHCHEFDYLIINNDFDQCLEDLRAIIIAKRLRYSQQQHQNAELLSKLLETQ